MGKSIGEAFRYIQYGEADVMLAGGTDAYQLNQITTVKEVIGKYFPESVALGNS